MDDALGRIIDRADRGLAVVENRLNLLAGILIFGLMFWGVIQIFMRTALQKPIFGYIDVVEVSMVGFAVLAISYVQRVGGHVRMELFVARLKGRAHWIAEAAGTALGIFIVAVLIPYSYDHFYRAFEFGDSTIDIEIITWPAKLVVPVALSILLVRFVIQLAGYVRLAIDPEREPVAVPLLKDVEAIAEDEILHAEEDIVQEHFSDAEKRGE